MRRRPWAAAVALPAALLVSLLVSLLTGVPARAGVEPSPVPFEAAYHFVASGSRVVQATSSGLTIWNLDGTLQQSIAIDGGPDSLDLDDRRLRAWAVSGSRTELIGVEVATGSIVRWSLPAGRCAIADAALANAVLLAVDDCQGSWAGFLRLDATTGATRVVALADPSRSFERLTPVGTTGAILASSQQESVLLRLPQGSSTALQEIARRTDVFAPAVASPDGTRIIDYRLHVFSGSDLSALGQLTTDTWTDTGLYVNGPGRNLYPNPVRWSAGGQIALPARTPQGYLGVLFFRPGQTAPWRKYTLTQGQTDQMIDMAFVDERLLVLHDTSRPADDNVKIIEPKPATKMTVTVPTERPTAGDSLPVTATLSGVEGNPEVTITETIGKVTRTLTTGPVGDDGTLTVPVTVGEAAVYRASYAGDADHDDSEDSVYVRPKGRILVYLPGAVERDGIYVYRRGRPVVVRAQLMPPRPGAKLGFEFQSWNGRRWLGSTGLDRRLVMDDDSVAVYERMLPKKYLGVPLRLRLAWYNGHREPRSFTYGYFVLGVPAR